MKVSKFKNFTLLMVALIIGIVVAGCSTNSTNNPNEDVVAQNPSSQELYTLEDDFGRLVTLDKAPDRIVSLAPSNTEILFALGLGDKVVGVTSFDDYPVEALEIEKIGDYSGINLEKIIELEPDLVVNYGPGNEEENKRLEEAGIKYVGFLPESIDAVLHTIIGIGQLTGTVDEAKVLTDNMIEKKDEVLSKIKGAETKKVFYEIWHDPLMAAGAGSFFDELITLAGGENIAKDADGEYPQFDLEQLIERNPEVYLTSADMPEKTPESIKERPGYGDIDAIINGNVYVLDGNILSRPGPRIIDALEIVAKSIHPEKF